MGWIMEHFARYEGTWIQDDSNCSKSVAQVFCLLFCKHQFIKFLHYDLVQPVGASACTSILLVFIKKTNKKTLLIFKHKFKEQKEITLPQSHRNQRGCSRSSNCVATTGSTSHKIAATKHHVWPLLVAYS